MLERRCLLLLGFELGDRHHRSNLNDLAELFGLRFNTDIVAPGPALNSKPYDAAIDVELRDPKHPLLSGLSSIRVWNAQSVSTEPGGSAQDGWPRRDLLPNLLKRTDDLRSTFCIDEAITLDWIEHPEQIWRYDLAAWVGMVMALPYHTRFDRTVTQEVKASRIRQSPEEYPCAAPVHCP